MENPGELAGPRPPLPVAPEAFDRAIELTAAEREALAAFRPDAPPLRHSRALGQLKQVLARFEQPLQAVAALRSFPDAHLEGARRALYSAMARADRSFWGWSAAEWLAFLGPTPAAFVAAHGWQARRGRMTLLDLAYLLGGVSDLRPAGIAAQATKTARIMFGADRLGRVARRVLEALTAQGFQVGAGQHWVVTQTLSLALLLNRSPNPEDLSVAVLGAVAHGGAADVTGAAQRVGLALELLGLLRWPVRPPRPDGADDPQASAGAATEWAAWCRAWYHQAVRPALPTRHKQVGTLFAVGRWLESRHPEVRAPDQWDEALALEYVQYACSARVGDDTSPLGRQFLAARHHLGAAHLPRTIDQHLGALRRAFNDWQQRPHAVAGVPPRAIPIRFNPQIVFATPPPIRARIQPDPRDIDLGVWYKLAYAAAHLSAADLAQHHQQRYPLALYRALALLWVTSARRPNELRRLRVGCVRRDWDPSMRDDNDQPLERADREMCYLHVPPNKTRGPFWVWIPAYTAEALAAWERERPARQPPRPDPKEGTLIDFLFAYRGQPIGERFLNRCLLPLLCAVAGVPEQDARGQITAHRGRSTRATLLRKLGVPLADIAAYLGHANETTVRSYARTDNLQLAQVIRRADARSRLVEGLIDVPAAQAGRPNVFFFLGHGPDGRPRYCGNPAWASCPHRLACLKCRMFVGGSAAEMLEAREGVIRFQSQVPMTPEEQAAADGDVGRLNERLAELQGVPVPEPPSDAFIFNPEPVADPLPQPMRPPGAGDRRAELSRRLADLRQEIARAEQQGRRGILVRALKSQLATVEADLNSLGPAFPAALSDVGHAGA